MSNGILLQSGKFYSYDKPEDNNFDIQDIALSLSNICRYGGSVSHHYSVAQHSVYVSLCVPEEYALEGLLHDAAEAFLGDIPTPLKHMLPDYRAIEETHEREIFKRFGLSYPMSDAVKLADRKVLLREIIDLKPPSDYWVCLFTTKPYEKSIVAHGPEYAREMFLERYYQITNKEK